MSNTLDMPLYRNIFLYSQVTQDTMKDVTKEIIDINEDDKRLKHTLEALNMAYTPKPINIYIDSYGGMIYQCFGLISVMEDSETPVHTHVTGSAKSAGFLILIHGHKRFAYEHSTPLYHQMSGGFYGTVKDAEVKVEEYKRLQKKIEEITIKKTNITKKKLKEILNTKTDWYMDSEEALKLGVIDEIIRKDNK